MGVPVTVLIPTYNWSAALKISIASALAQTYADFELLVIGDECTDESEEVVRAFADKRVQWHNLTPRHGTQSGPNNFGISQATGGLIAYLGHDDVWHPEHLESAVAKLEETGADLACGVCAMYGPPKSGVRFVSGVFSDSQYRRRDFMPPSSWVHRKELIERIGGWRRPEELAAPVDCELLQRAFEAGARIVSTERLTVFKFNSAWRRDSYLRRDVSEQETMLARLRANAGGCVEQEWAGLMRARREFRLVDATMPEQWDAPAGELYRTYMRARGLQTVAVDELREARRFTLEDQESCLDWHGVERFEERGPFRWTGPSPVATASIPVCMAGAFRVRVQILNWLEMDLATDLKMRVGGQRVEFVCREMEKPAVWLEAEVRAESGAGPLRVQVEVERTRCLYLETEGKSPETRWLGVCVEWIEVEPADVRPCL